MISFEEYERIYGLLGVKIDNAYGEAFYENMLHFYLRIRGKTPYIEIEAGE